MILVLHMCQVPGAWTKLRRTSWWWGASPAGMSSLLLSGQLPPNEPLLTWDAAGNMSTTSLSKLVPVIRMGDCRTIIYCKSVKSSVKPLTRISRHSSHCRCGNLPVRLPPGFCTSPTLDVIDILLQRLLNLGLEPSNTPCSLPVELDRVYPGYPGSVPRHQRP